MKVIQLRGQHRLRIDLDFRVTFGLFGIRHRVPSGIKRVIVGAFLNEHGDHADCSITRLVNQVHLHRKLLAVDRVFTGRMKMKLLQFKTPFAGKPKTAGLFVFLYRVAIKDQMDF